MIAFLVFVCAMIRGILGKTHQKCGSQRQGNQGLNCHLSLLSAFARTYREYYRNEYLKEK